MYGCTLRLWWKTRTCEIHFCVSLLYKRYARLCYDCIPNILYVNGYKIMQMKRISHLSTTTAGCKIAITVRKWFNAFVKLLLWAGKELRVTIVMNVVVPALTSTTYICTTYIFSDRLNEHFYTYIHIVAWIIGMQIRFFVIAMAINNLLLSIAFVINVKKNKWLEKILLKTGRILLNLIWIFKRCRKVYVIYIWAEKKHRPKTYTLFLLL